MFRLLARAAAVAALGQLRLPLGALLALPLVLRNAADIRKLLLGHCCYCPLRRRRRPSRSATTQYLRPLFVLVRTSPPWHVANRCSALAAWSPPSRLPV